MSQSNIQTITRTIGEMIESMIIFFQSITEGYYLILFGFLFISIITLIFHFFEEIVQWVGRMSE